MAGDTLRFSMRSRQWEDFRVREAGHGLKSMFLTVAGGAVVSVGALVDVVVAGAALIRQPEEARLSRRQKLEPRVPMTGLAPDRGVSPRQTKLQTGMIEFLQLGNPREREGAPLNQTELCSMMLQMALLAARRGVLRQRAVQSASFLELSRDLFMADQAGLRHTASGRPMASAAVLRARQARILGVDGGEIAGRRIALVRLPDPDDQQERDRAHGERVANCSCFHGKMRA